MKRFVSYVGFRLLAFAVILYFVPKVNCYYFAEQQVEPFGVVIGEEKAYDRGLWLELEGGEVYFEKIPSASIGETEVILLGLYNSIDVRDVTLSETLERFAPRKIDTVSIRYTILDPLNIHIDAAGDFGTATAKVAILDGVVTALVSPSQLMKARFGTTLRTMTPDESGGYRYESRF